MMQRTLGILMALLLALTALFLPTGRTFYGCIAIFIH